MSRETIFLSGFLAVFLFVSRADAANLNATPSLWIGAGWDSNIFNTESNEQKDYVFRAAPRLSLSLEGPTTKAELIGGIEGENTPTTTNSIRRLRRRPWVSGWFGPAPA